MDLHNHKINVHTQTFHCDQCDFSDSQKKRLTQHIKRKHKEDIFHCSDKECEFRTISNSELLLHYNTLHSTKRAKYECKICKFETDDKIILEDHMRQGHLNQHHKTVHSSDIEFNCSQCSFVATGISALNSHIGSVHSIGKFKCDKCDFSDNQKNRLTQHIKRKHKRNHV